jgi:hypothetical protein
MPLRGCKLASSCYQHQEQGQWDISSDACKPPSNSLQLKPLQLPQDSALTSWKSCILDRFSVTDLFTSFLFRAGQVACHRLSISKMEQ